MDGTMAPYRSVDENVGRHAQIVHWYVPWGASWGTFDYQRPLLDNMHEYASVGEDGSVPLITWEPWAPPFQRDDNLPGLRMFVGVDHRFARDAIKV